VPDPDESVQVATGDGSMPACVWYPTGGRGPGLLLLQEIFGVSRYIRQRAADLAAAGYVVLAPELYWRLDRTTVEETAPDALEQGIALSARLSWQTAAADAVAAFERLRELTGVTGGAGVIGFCFGGGLAFQVAADADPDALVSYYGSALPELLDLAPQVRAPSLHHFGLADDFFPPAVVGRVRQAVTAGGAAQFHTYEGANHAFDNPDFPMHHAEASAEAWERTLGFLGEVLPPS
jgi:carboxymethylenebutenolidase